MKKHILIFSTAYHPFVGGAEIAVKEITDRMSDCEFDMITLNLDGKQKREELIGNILVHRIGGGTKFHKYLYPIFAWYKARKQHINKKYDGTWSIMASYSGFAALFFKYSYSHIPFILTLQEGDPIDYIKRQVRWVYPLFRKIFTKADHIQAISHYLAQFARDMGATCPISVIPNGVDIATFTQTYTQQELEPVIKEINKKPEDTILITTSRLVEKNAVEDIIAALTYLPDSVKLIILGIGKLEYKLKKQTQDLNISHRVLFLGQKNYSDIPTYLAVSDIFIRPSLSEGMGNSFIEAMAAHIPVIATPVGGIPDFIQDEITGLLCKVHNPESIAEKVSLLMDTPELREKIILQAQHLVKQKYNWDIIVEGMKKVFQ